MGIPTTIDPSLARAKLRIDRASLSLLAEPVWTYRLRLAKFDSRSVGDQRLTTHDAPNAVELQGSSLWMHSTAGEG
jgi:hypothetical protein